MNFSEKSKPPQKRRLKTSWSPTFFFFSLSFPPALILTIIFWLSGIKTPLWSERGTRRYPWARGYIAVFLFLWVFMTCVGIFLYVFFFSVKILFLGKINRKKVSSKILIFLGDQLLTYFLSIALLQKKWVMRNSLFVLFLFMPLNWFFIHYFFSRPVMKILHKQYPYYFPKFFDRQEETKMRVDEIDLTTKKSRTTGWPLMLTLTVVNFQIFSLLFIVQNCSNKKI